jgi:DNA polymerase III subunit gamma/tau
VSKEPYHISLYRQYRPVRFIEVIGQDEITRTLKNAVMTNNVAHAYLFSGERGIGKTSVARILARAVNCLSQEDGEPCNTCNNCQTILSNRSLDIMEIDGASNRGIDHIRRLRDEVAFSPTDLKTKVYIIDEVHMLTNEAFNALLKTLEEPPPHVVFIFATTEVHKVPRTIVSRCQAFHFRKIPPEKIGSRLAQIAAAERINVTDSAISLIATRANGGMRDAIVMLEQAGSFAGEHITEDILLDMLGLVGSEVHRQFLQSLESGNRALVLERIDSLVDQGKDLETFLDDLVAHVRDRLISKGDDTARDIAICRGLLEIKQDILRSLDSEILLEVGLLSLIEQLNKNGLLENGQTSLVDGPAYDLSADSEGKTPEKQALSKPKTVDQDSASPLPTGADKIAKPEALEEAAPEIDEKLAERWSSLLKAVESERIAMAAFLSEGKPELSGEKLSISFHPDHTFHKESLEKPANLQYLAGMARLHISENCYVEIKLDNGVKRKQTPSEELRKKVDLVCELFDGKIVEEG